MLEDKLVDTSEYYNPRKRLGVPAIVNNRKRLRFPIRAREFASKKARVQGTDTGEGSFSAALEVKDENVPINTVVGVHRRPDPRNQHCNHRDFTKKILPHFSMSFS